jgi:penicillin-binding protein 2
VGKTVQLNLDLRLQRLATEELSKYASVGKPGAAVALDPTNGRVLALVSVPGYDPNQFIGGISKTDWDALQKHKLKPQINRSVGSAYAPGSVFKLMVAAEALDLGLISQGTSFKCDGVYKVGTWSKHCHKRAGHGYVDLERAIASSCDIYFYRVGQLMGPERLAKCAKRYGFGSKTEIDIAGENDGIERSGTVPDPEWKLKRKLGPWVGGDTVDYAMGQSMLTVTPLQLCRAVAAIGNGGTLYRPQLVRRILSRDDKGAGKVEFEPKVTPMGEIGITERSRNFVLRAMETTVAHGTAGSAQVAGIRVLGKTGTAQMVSDGHLVDNAWFVALAPAENPKIAVCVFVEAAGHGGDIAAPIARKLIARYMNIPLDPKPPVKQTGRANQTPATTSEEANQ